MHTEDTQAPPWQSCPHLPQLAGSLVVSTHGPPASAGVIEPLAVLELPAFWEAIVPVHAAKPITANAMADLARGGPWSTREIVFLGRAKVNAPVLVVVQANTSPGGG
jgi:hypothetical protein